MILSLLLAVTLCDPCLRAYPLACEGAACRELSDVPVIGCAQVQKSDLYETGVAGVRLYWRLAEVPLPPWQWVDIPAVETEVDGVEYVHFQGGTPVGDRHPADMRRYRRTNLVPHKYLSLTPGTVVPLAITPYNVYGGELPQEVPCADGPCGAEVCGHLTMCWYHVWDASQPFSEACS